MKDREYLTDLIRKHSFPLAPAALDPEVLQRLHAWTHSQKTSAFKAVLFDIYGTLFVSGSGDISLANDRTLNPVEKDTRVDSLLHPRFTVKDLPRLRKLFVDAVRSRHRELRVLREVPEIQVEEIWRNILGIEEDAAREFSLRFELAVNPVYPMPGALELLRFLNCEGLILGLVSNAQFFTPLLFEAFFNLDLSELGFREDLCVYSYREGEAKPSPRLYAKAARTLSELGVSAEEGLYIGNDMLNDVWAAKSAGFKTALFAGDKRSLRLRGDDDRCADLRPDILLKSLNEIQQFIKR